MKIQWDHLRSWWWRFPPIVQGLLGCWLLQPEHSTSPQSWQGFLQYFLVRLPAQFWLPHFRHVRSCRDFFEACWLLRESSGLRFWEEVLSWSEDPASEMCELSCMAKNGELWCTTFPDELLGGFSCSANVTMWYSDIAVDEDWATCPESSYGVMGICCCKTGGAAADLSELWNLSTTALTFMMACDKELFSLTLQSHLWW